MSKLTDGMTENANIKDDVKEVEVTETIKTVEKPVVEEPKTDIPDNVINLDLREAARTKIWVNGDCQKIIELNLTDMGIISRFSDTYPKLLSLQEEVKMAIDDGKPEDLDDIDDLNTFASQFKIIDKKMRDYVDYIFDGKVSDVCCDGGSMYDLVAGGWWRFEYIIDKLGNLYKMKFGDEMKKNDQRMKMHTERYTGKSKYTKKRNTRK